ncbi:hypothetical protein CPB83DRAFT_223685 [Crepidotus variabilis]|uniref:HBS1-like protein N-terminal domain-containing protein n=1 Tax=Crepidotus variabilis TaxID=179855 RepID=A0A9P6ERV9_9AGAR|nr:hypothetical protein CPB83DRAFT_223685 [Crepidotus variabilis]
MSRHRAIRNMKYEDALEDDALSDGGGDELTQEQEAQLNDGLEQIRLVIGGEDTTGLSDQSIKDALWEYYFDAEKALHWALEEQQRRSIAKERKGPWGEQQPLDNQIQHQLHQDEEDVQDYHDTNTGPRLPSIFLAQQQPDFDSEAYLAAASESPQQMKRYLSTITERTERTEPSTLLHSRQQTYPRDSRISMMTSSYGDEIGNRMSLNSEGPYQNYNQSRPLDPNTSRNSPSLSAIEILAKFEPPPDNSSSSTLGPLNPPYTSSDPVSSLENLPTIPDLESRSSHRPRFSKDLPITPAPSSPNKPQSKLSKLASSRGSSASSISSRSSGTAVTGSIKTFPNLRPSAQSEVQSEWPASPVFSEGSSKSLPPLPNRSQPSFPSSTSLIINQAIETAMNMGELDKHHMSTPKAEVPPSMFGDSERSKTPTPRDFQPEGLSGNVEKPSSPAKPLSKLAQLAQKKAESTISAHSSHSSKYDLPSPVSSVMSREPRPLSKLALLAQQKVDATRVPKLPKTKTEYLTPIANGPSVTTAITTSYQSLYSLTDPSKSSVIPRLDVVPLSAVSGTSSPSSMAAEAKTSKLAKKIKRASEKTLSAGFPSEQEIATPPLSPLFLPNDSAGTRALPSAFASILINDLDSGTKDKEDKDKDAKRKRHKEKKKKVKDNEKESSTADSHPHRSRKHKHSSSKTKSTDEASGSAVQPFTFESPSPDDIVLNARKGTSLSQKSSSTAKLSVATGKIQVAS